MLITEIKKREGEAFTVECQGLTDKCGGYKCIYTYTYTYNYDLLKLYSRKQHSTVKQFSSN